jgi:hypothetical protein
MMPEFLSLLGITGPFASPWLNAILCTALLMLFILTPLNMIENMGTLRFSSVFGLCFSGYLVGLILDESITTMASPGDSLMGIQAKP